jgi:hypothetical protein
MTTYRTIASTEDDPNAPLVSALTKAWTGNTLAIAECDLSAPTNQAAWHPYNRIAAGSSNVGRIYNFGTDGVVASVVTPDYADGFEYRIRVVALSHNNGTTVDLQIENFRETDTAYNPAHAFNDTGNNTSFWTGDVELLDVRQISRAHHFRTRLAILTSNAAAAANVGERVDLFTTAQPILKSRISFAVGSIDAGQIFLDRRAVYS